MSLDRAMALASLDIEDGDIKPDRSKLRFKAFDLANYRLPIDKEFGEWKVAGEPELGFRANRVKCALIPVKHTCGNMKLVRYHRLLSGERIGCKHCPKPRARRNKWFIKGFEFETGQLAAEYFKVNYSTILRWVYGRNDSTAQTPPRSDCWVV